MFAENDFLKAVGLDMDFSEEENGDSGQEKDVSLSCIKAMDMISTQTFSESFDEEESKQEQNSRRRGAAQFGSRRSVVQATDIYGDGRSRRFDTL